MFHARLRAVRLGWVRVGLGLATAGLLAGCAADTSTAPAERRASPTARATVDSSTPPGDTDPVIDGGWPRPPI
ncbi:MAG TPA: hypothetical protein VGM50_02430 [Gemmatimonadaceae bacterium]|jgi:hypothetical protein